MVVVRVTGTSAKGSPYVNVEVPGISDTFFEQIRDNLHREISNLGPTDGITSTFLDALSLCPQANPSDLWLYAIYLEYIATIGNDQSWKRASGFAFERVIKRNYDPILDKQGLGINIVTKEQREALLAEFRLSSVDVPPSKLDMAVMDSTTSDTVAVLHAKVSIAERISDDAPASRRLMASGCPSAAITLDMKHFPPPHGDGVNYGELGGRPAASGVVKQFQQKRAYIEESGDFDALFSFNLRTPPSVEHTNSGKRIYTLSFSEPQPDEFVKWLMLQREKKE